MDSRDDSPNAAYFETPSYFQFQAFPTVVFQWQKRNGPFILCVLCLLLLSVLDESIFAFNPRQFHAIWYGEGNKARPKRGQRTDLGGGRSVFVLTLCSPSPDHSVVSEITWPQPPVLARRSGCTAHLSFGPGRVNRRCARS